MKPEYLLTLLSLPRIGQSRARLIDNNTKMPINSLDDFLDNLKAQSVKDKTFTIPNKDTLEKIFSSVLVDLEKMKKADIKVIMRDSLYFPQSLLIIPDNPIILFAKGNLELLKESYAVAVVGTRGPSQYGKKRGALLTEHLVENHLIIVSGLAKGCDTIAHETCLSNGGRTIAILAHGLDECYPKENKKLSEIIVEKQGLLLSEYKMGVKTQRSYFVQRDRLQSGCSRAVCVIETHINGGTMHTVDFAEKQNRLVACIDYTSDKEANTNSDGNNLLIDKKKAIPLASPTQVNNFISRIKLIENDCQQAAVYPVPDPKRKTMQMEFCF
jgi:DNA processing protein